MNSTQVFIAYTSRMDHIRQRNESPMLLSRHQKLPLEWRKWSLPFDNVTHLPIMTSKSLKRLMTTAKTLVSPSLANRQENDFLLTPQSFKARRRKQMFRYTPFSRQGKRFSVINAYLGTLRRGIYMDIVFFILFHVLGQLLYAPHRQHWFSI